MSLFHLDPLLRITPCSGENCPISPSSTHFRTRDEALQAASLTRELAALQLPQHQMDFHRSFSAKTQQYFLEASVLTPFEEEAIFTVEETGDCYRGTMLFTGQEIILTNVTDFMDNPLEETARLTALEAQRLYGFDLWPDRPTIDLYDKLMEYSTPDHIYAPESLSLELVFSKAGQQNYRGETAVGTEIAVRVAHGYAVATTQKGSKFSIVNESGTSHQVFTEPSERAIFVAKSFGRLLSLNEI